MKTATFAVHADCPRPNFDTEFAFLHFVEHLCDNQQAVEANRFSQQIADFLEFRRDVIGCGDDPGLWVLYPLHSNQ